MGSRSWTGDAANRMAMTAEKLATAKDGDGLYKRAAEITGYNDGTLRQYRMMSEQFEMLCRHNILSYQHHREVSSIKSTIENDDGTLAVGFLGSKGRQANVIDLVQALARGYRTPSNN